METRDAHENFQGAGGGFLKIDFLVLRSCTLKPSCLWSKKYIQDEVVVIESGKNELEVPSNMLVEGLETTSNITSASSSLKVEEVMS